MIVCSTIYFGSTGSEADIAETSGRAQPARTVRGIEAIPSPVFSCARTPASPISRETFDARQREAGVVRRRRSFTLYGQGGGFYEWSQAGSIVQVAAGPDYPVLADFFPRPAASRRNLAAGILRRFCGRALSTARFVRFAPVVNGQHQHLCSPSPRTASAAFSRSRMLAADALLDRRLRVPSSRPLQRILASTC